MSQEVPDSPDKGEESTVGKDDPFWRYKENMGTPMDPSLVGEWDALVQEGSPGVPV